MNNNIEYRRTKNGLVKGIYGDQKKSSKRRNHDAPDYTLQELRQWVFSQSIFHELYNAWVESNFDINFYPSIDRKDDYKPYTFENMQLMTWRENQLKSSADRKNGINKKVNKPVVQMSIDGLFIKEHHSIGSASRETKTHSPHISMCCSGKLKTANGFMWMKSLGISIINNTERKQ